MAWLSQGVPAVLANDWPQFRGAMSNSVATEADFPAEWDLADADASRMIAWKVELPGRGPSSPIVVGQTVILTASSGHLQDRLHVLAFDVTSGRRLWERQFWATGRTITHPQSANAAPTPVSDGEHVFAFFSSNNLAAVDLQGNLLWYRGLGVDYPRAGNDVGMASSPVLIDGTLVVQSESQGDAFAAGIDVRDGSNLWRVDREKLASWTSPVVLPGENGEPDRVLIQSTRSLSCLDPASGRELWNHAARCDAIASACGRGRTIYLPSEGITALSAKSDSATPEVLWNSNQLQPGAASPIVVDGKLLLINRGGVLVAADASDGQILSRTRLEGTFWGTPVIAGRRLFVVSFEGVGQLVELAEDFRSAKVVGKIALGETVQASPAAADGAVFVRSDRHLFKLASPSPSP